MFLVIPLVEFLHVLGVDIHVHHENPTTFLGHVSVSSVQRSRHRFASSRWHPVLTLGAQERHETNWGDSIVSPRPACCLSPQVLEKAMYSTKLVVTSAAFSMWAFSVGAVSIAPADVMA